MDNQQAINEYGPAPYTFQEIAGEVAAILAGRLGPKDILKLFHITFLEVSEAAELLRVKERTIYTWISQDRIPVRYANGKPVFLLSELINWTLPEDDKHTKHRLPMANHCSIAESRLAAIRERN